jgi:hypothetical protein
VTALLRPVSRVGLGNVASLGNATHSGWDNVPGASGALAGMRIRCGVFDHQTQEGKSSHQIPLQVRKSCA